MTLLRVWALLLVAGLAQANEQTSRQTQEEQKEVASRVDPVSSSFYFDVRRKVQPLLCQQPSLKEQAKFFGKAVACGVICDLVAGRWLLEKVSLRGVVGARLGTQPDEPDAREQAADPCVVVEEAQPRPRAWLGSGLLAALAAAAAVAGSKARGGLGHRRRLSSCQSSSCSVINSPRSRLSDMSTSASSTPGAVTAGEESESSDLEDDDEDEEVDPPRSQMQLSGAARDSVRRSLLSAKEGPFCRQRTDPSSEGPKDSHRSLRKTSGGNRSEFIRQQSNPAPKSRKISNIDSVPALSISDPRRWPSVKYGDKGFVRQRTQEYERKIDFHRMASESSVAAEGGSSYEEYENMDMRTAFFRIGTENVWGSETGP